MAKVIKMDASGAAEIAVRVGFTSTYADTVVIELNGIDGPPCHYRLVLDADESLAVIQGLAQGSRNLKA